MSYYSPKVYREIMRRTDQYEKESKNTNGVGDYNTSRARAEREVKYSLPAYRV
jgi:hypothetical protein